jgi:hypothetical protein
MGNHCEASAKVVQRECICVFTCHTEALNNLAALEKLQGNSECRLLICLRS